MSVRNGFTIENIPGLCTFLACAAHGDMAMEDWEGRRRRQAREQSRDIEDS